MLFMMMMVLNFVGLIAALFFSDEWSDRGKVGLVAFYLALWFVPGNVITSAAPANVFFIVGNLALALHFAFKFQIGQRRAYS